jgi:hypothetical protein
MALRFKRRRSRSQSIAQLRIAFRNVREVAGTTVLFPDWSPAPERESDLAIVLHLPAASRIGEYLRIIESAGVSADVVIVIPPEQELPVTPEWAGAIEVLQADPVGAGMYQLTALLNSGRLTGYRTVVRHVDSELADLDRFARLELAHVDSVVHADLDRVGVYVSAGSQPRLNRDVAYRTSQLLKRVSTRFRNEDLAADDRSIATVAIRGSALEMLRPLRIDHQDFYSEYAQLIHEGQAIQYRKAPVADGFAPRAITSALLVFLDAAGMRLDELSDESPVQPGPVAATRRATAWAVYHPDLSVPTPTRNATWSHLAGSMPMYLGQQLPMAPGVLGFADPLLPADRSKQVGLAVQAGISGFLVASEWDESGLQPRAFFDSLPDGDPFPFAVFLQHSGIRRINPEGINARMSPWVDPGPEFYSMLASSVGELIARSPSYVSVDDRPVVIIRDLATLTRPADFLAALRAGIEATTGATPWLGIVETNLTTSRPGDGIIPAGADGVVQIPPMNGGTRKRIRIGGRFGGFTGPVHHMAPAVGGTPTSIMARSDEHVIPGAFVGFDTTPELRAQGTVGYNWNVALFAQMLESAVRSVAWRDESSRIVVINSWNGWSDTSQLEPGYHRGSAYLSAVKNALFF